MVKEKTPEHQQHQPNILIAISDDQSFPYASAYGSTLVTTPHFDRVADAGVLFTNAFVASPGCSPSRAALLTGRYPWQLENAGTHSSYFPQQYVVFPDLLEEAGYMVGYTGKGWGPGDWEASGRERNPAGNSYNEFTLNSGVDGISSIDYSRNFEAFLDEREPERPFCFWYGAQEPHRRFEEGIGRRSGKQTYQADVPSFLPDHPVIRQDLLDYAYEIEWFDRHLGRILELIERKDELDNTIVIVTSDNGMAFPRAKANAYEYGIHVPLAVMWPNQIPADRTVEDVVSLIDLTPTILEAASATHPGTPSMSGSSLLDLLRSHDEGLVDKNRHVYSARERHSSSRYNSLSYPQRALRTQDFLYIRNYTPERWPAGAPQKFENGGILGPFHDAYHDIDGCPSLTYLVENRDDPSVRRFFHLSVDKRPVEELYDIKRDPGCLINLVDAPGYESTLDSLATIHRQYLLETNDPRETGNGDIFETYPRVSRLRWFPEPDWVTDEKSAFRPAWLSGRENE